MPVAPRFAVGITSSVNGGVAGLSGPMALTPGAVKESLPSGPLVMNGGPRPAVGIGNAVITLVAGLSCSMALSLEAVKYKLPSGAAVIKLREPMLAVGMKKD